MILLFVHIQHLVFMVIIAVMNKKILLALISAKEHVHFFYHYVEAYITGIFFNVSVNYC